LGKVRYIGASAYASWQLAHANVLAQLRGWTPFVVLQSEYNLLDRSVEREYCLIVGPIASASFPIIRWQAVF
jgi:aryl-alcohol dehydrogenase-like predicted oxidoreductase